MNAVGRAGDPTNPTPIPTGVVELDGVLRRYEWGSVTAIPELLGLPADGRPAAELWFGAHPDDPSGVPVHGRTLDEIIGDDPPVALGTAVVSQFGPRLPFLLKVLAAQKALSIQVHPSLAQARDGYAAEDAAGVDRTAGNRNYRDANHKPELLCALTPFEALCGFRPVAATLELLDRAGIAQLDFLAELLRGPQPLRSAFTALLTHEQPGPLVRAVAAQAAAEPDGPLRAAFLAAQDFPDDIGVVLALLLNHVRLEPGEAIYLGAGNVHAYLRGTGVEIMANSDNVLRCGLTSKHVDVDELLAITDFSALADPRRPASAGIYAVPVPDFSLTRVAAPDAVILSPGVPHIVLGITAQTSVGDLTLGPGHAAFVAATLDGDDVDTSAARSVDASPDGGRTVRTNGLAFVASPGALT